MCACVCHLFSFSFNKIFCQKISTIILAFFFLGVVDFLTFLVLNVRIFIFDLLFFAYLFASVSHKYLVIGTITYVQVLVYTGFISIFIQSRQPSRI